MPTDAFRTADGRTVTAVTADEMREVDRVAVEEFDLPLASMMENAGRNLAAHVREVATGRVTVVAGAGGNGGGGLAAARHLHNRDVGVSVVLGRPADEVEGVPGRQLSVCKRSGVPIRVGPETIDRRTGTVVDAVVGYGLDGPLSGTPRELAEAIRRRSSTVVSLDVPSGLDATTGRTGSVAVDPDRVVTLALPKTGLSAVDAELYLADIGIPPAVFEAAGVDYDAPFHEEYWVGLTGPA